MPLGATAVSAALVDALTEGSGFDLSHTYNANPIACAAGAAVVDEMTDRGLIENGATVGAELMARMNDLASRWSSIGDVRGRGLMIGLELVSDKETKRPFSERAAAAVTLRRLALENGLMIGGRRLNGGSFGEFLMLTPALTINSSEVDEICERMDSTFAMFTEHMRSEST